MLLEEIRRLKSGILSWFIIGGVAVVFIFWGIGTRQSQQARAATVNGHDILFADLEREAARLEQRYRELFRGSLPEGLVSRLDLHRQAFDRLIEQILIRQEVERLGLAVSDEELREAIAARPEFQREGRFDRLLYTQLLAGGAFGPDLRTPAAFEAALREDLLRQKLERLVVDAVQVTDAEVRQAYADQYDRVELEVVRVPARPDPAAPVPEDELVAYYEAHKAEYTRPATVSVVAVAASPERFEPLVTVTDDEVRRRYEARRAELSTPPQVSARHILVAVPPDASPEAVEAARQKARAALERLRKGEDFGKVALEVSDDRATLRDRARAGDLGFFARGTMVKPFEDAAFALKPGELSDVVRTPFGFHVIRVDAVREGRTPPLEEVRAQLEREIRLEKARRQAAEQAEALAEAAARSGDLEAEAKRAGLRAVRVGPIAAGESAPQLGPSGRVALEALKLQPGQVSPPIEDGGTWYVVQATARSEPVVPPLAEVKDRVRAGLARQKAAAAARTRAAEILESARKSGDLTAAARTAGLRVERTGPFGRDATEVPGLGRSREAVEAAFRLTTSAPFPEQPIALGDDSAVVRLLRRLPADPAADPQGFARVRQALEREKRQAAFEQFLRARRQAAALWVSPQLPWAATAARR
ncbi:MAG TPA: SurA N-terminal domain-containing protein [Thermodesulfobacteriota bacterium]|nr:SurA N-terminal domain-containing protein [Thermodesulfobacteriota bacterium]